MRAKPIMSIAIPFLSTEHRLRWAGGGSLLLGEIPWLKLSFNN